MVRPCLGLLPESIVNLCIENNSVVLEFYSTL